MSKHPTLKDLTIAGPDVPPGYYLLDDGTYLIEDDIVSIGKEWLLGVIGRRAKSFCESVQRCQDTQEND